MDELPERILMTTDTVGGVWTYARVLAGRFAGRGPEVVLAAMGGEPDEPARRRLEQLPGVELHCADLALEWMDSPWEEVDRAGDWLRDLCETTDPDVVHLNNYAHGDLGWGRPVLMVGHSCVCSWFEAVEGRAAPARFDEYRRRVAAGLRAADLVAAPTRAMLVSLKRHYGPLPECRVVSNGLCPERFASRPAEPMVLTAGRLWDEAKNVAAVREVAAESSWPVYVAGRQESPDGGEVDLGGLQVLGELAREDLKEWYARAPVYALPARYEPFGLTPLEAAMSGCALVLGDIDSLREVWGKSAIYVDPDAPRELAEVLEAFAGDPALLGEMQRRAAGRARRYRADRMAHRYLELYGRLLEGTAAVESLPRARGGR